MCIAHLMAPATSNALSRHWRELPDHPGQATAHSLRTQAGAGTRLSARQRPSAVGLHQSPFLATVADFGDSRRIRRLQSPVRTGHNIYEGGYREYFYEDYI